jgi:hypothetical protein
MVAEAVAAGSFILCTSKCSTIFTRQFALHKSKPPNHSLHPWNIIQQNSLDHLHNPVQTKTPPFWVHVVIFGARSSISIH